VKFTYIKKQTPQSRDLRARASQWEAACLLDVCVSINTENTENTPQSRDLRARASERAAFWLPPVQSCRLSPLTAPKCATVYAIMCQKETYLHEKRPTCTKRDVSLRKETYTRDLLPAISVDSSEIRHCIRNYVSKKRKVSARKETYLYEKRPISEQRDLHKRALVGDLRWKLWNAPLRTQTRVQKQTYLQEKRPVCTKRDLRKRPVCTRDLFVQKETYTRDLMNAVFVSSSQIRHFARAKTCQQDDLSMPKENPKIRLAGNVRWKLESRIMLSSNKSKKSGYNIVVVKRIKKNDLRLYK